jgi:hypothetical protein
MTGFGEGFVEVFDGTVFAARERGVSFPTIGEEAIGLGVDSVTLFFFELVLPELNELFNGPGLLTAGPS